MSSFLRNASIALKVSMAPAVAIACLVLVAAIGWWANASLNGELSDIGEDSVKRIVDADGLSGGLTELHQQVYQSLTWEAVGKSEDKTKAYDGELLKRFDAFDKRVQAAAQAEGLSEEQQARMTEFAKGYAQYAKVARDTLDIKTAGVSSAATYVTTLDDIYRKSKETMSAFVQYEVDAARARVAHAAQGGQRNSLVIAGTALAGLLIAAALSAVFVKSISRPLNQAEKVAGLLAQGDLTRVSRVDSTDATGRVLAALGEVSRGLTTMVTDIRSTAHEIDTASGEIASGNSDLSARTESTASALQQAAASIEELTATVRQSADNASEANQLARNASGVARRGGEMVADVVQTMDAINSQAKSIGEIIGTIDSIAFQTNILALNAAVEAARAGEQGRGFSVVASEVRLLAQRSAESAREIRTLISSSVEQIDSGVHKVQAAGQTMGQIVQAIEQVSSTVDGIARAASEQASGIAQVNQTVSEMERSTQQNAAMVEQASAATESLRQQSQRLVELLSRFRTA